MRVLHVTYEYPGVTDNCGGGGRVTRLLHERLEARGHDSTVVTDEADGHWATFPLRALHRLRERIRRFEPDVVHGHFALPSSLFLPRLVPEDTPLVITCMGADVYDPTRFEMIRPATDAVVGRILDAADAVVAPSTDMVERVEQKWAITPRYIPHGIDPDCVTWHHRQQSTAPTVITVCRLVERKQLDLAIEAVAEWRARSGDDITYRIVGRGSERDRLAEEYADREWLELAGYVDDLDSALATADIFLLTSSHEAFGLAVAEGIAAGLPAVVTNTGGQTDIVDTSVGAVAEPDADSLANALASVHARYERTQRATEDYIRERFSATRMARQYEQLYQTLYRDHAPTPRVNVDSVVSWDRSALR